MKTPYIFNISTFRHFCVLNIFPLIFIKHPVKCTCVCIPAIFFCETRVTFFMFYKIFTALRNTHNVVIGVEFCFFFVQQMS